MTDNWDVEQRAVAAAFQKGMAPFQEEPIILYGIGKNTPAALELTHGFTFAGLLDRDPDNVGKIIFGKPLLSLEGAAKVSKRIVIIARPNYVPLIYQRIRAFAEAHGISIYDYTGKELKPVQEDCDNSGLELWNLGENELRSAIASHEVISFDVFDTLIGRRVLHPEDVFDLVERDLHHAGCTAPFAELRVQAEKASGYAASLDDIYEALHEMGFSREECRDWRSRELAWEKKVVFPRRRIVASLAYAKEVRKKIFLTSDMYLSTEEMEALLKVCGITDYDGLLISCEEKAQKSDGTLFERLLDRAQGHSVLHIGDSAYSDGAAAQEKGIDTFPIRSGYDLFMLSVPQTLLANAPEEGLGGRLALGMLCADLFEDPFVLHETKGNVVLSQAERVGYNFLGPWTLGFIQWAAEQAELHGVEEFLFSARDGFLFYRAGLLAQKYGLLHGVALKYIKTSRRALLGASIQSEKDLKNALERRVYHGMLGRQLWDMFHIKPDSSDPRQWEKTEDLAYRFRYMRGYLPEIVERSTWERKNYMGYLRAKGLLHTKKTAFFDFYSRGTIQHYLEKLLEKPLLGLYCGQSIVRTWTFWRGSDILSAFGTGSGYSIDSDFYMLQVYVTLESLLIDGDRSLDYIDEDLQPVFLEDEGFSYEQALRTQDAVLKFETDYLELFGPEKIALRDADWFLRVLFGGKYKILPPAANAFIHDDTWEVNLERRRTQPIVDCSEPEESEQT